MECNQPMKMLYFTHVETNIKYSTPIFIGNPNILLEIFYNTHLQRRKWKCPYTPST